MKNVKAEILNPKITIPAYISFVILVCVSWPLECENYPWTKMSCKLELVFPLGIACCCIPIPEHLFVYLIYFKLCVEKSMLIVVQILSWDFDIEIFMKCSEIFRNLHTKISSTLTIINLRSSKQFSFHFYNFCTSLLAGSQVVISC